MDQLTQLYDAFGELVYVVAKADGIIQNEEVEALKKVISLHPFAEEITWSFNYELSKNSSVDEVYAKVLDTCHALGPRIEYVKLVQILEYVAKASNGIDKDESQVINKFTNDLTARFKADLDKGGLMA